MTISFDSDRHHELVATLTRAASSMQTELDSLEAEAAVLRDSWSGEGRVAYDRAHRQWSRTMASLNAALDAATRSADAAGAQLAQADQDVAASWE